MNTLLNPPEFKPGRIFREASEERIAKLVDFCQGKAAIAKEVLIELLGVDGSLGKAYSDYQLTLRQMQDRMAAAIRRGYLMRPGIRLAWTSSSKGRPRNRKGVGVIVGHDANAEPTTVDDLASIFRRHEKTVAEVAGASGIPLEALASMVAGQGKVNKKWYANLAALFQMTVKDIKNAFYRGCCHATWRDPELIMWPNEKAVAVRPAPFIAKIKPVKTLDSIKISIQFPSEGQGDCITICVNRDQTQFSRCPVSPKIDLLSISAANH